MAKTKKPETTKKSESTRTKQILEQQPKQSKRKGRPAGVTFEKKEAIIQINDVYRINLSDNRCKAIEKYLTKTRMNDGEDEQGNKWKSGDKYSEWSDIGCYCNSYKYAFDRLHCMMIEDGIKEKGTVNVKEFYEIYKKKLDFLEKLFKTDFTNK